MEEYTLQQVLDLLDAEFTKTYEEYLVAHRELNAFETELVNDKERYLDGKILDLAAVDTMNNYLITIQNKFREIWPIIYWAMNRNEFANNVTKEYNAFIERLKANGATDIEAPEIKPFDTQA